MAPRGSSTRITSSPAVDRKTSRASTIVNSVTKSAPISEPEFLKKETTNGNVSKRRTSTIKRKVQSTEITPSKRIKSEPPTIKSASKASVVRKTSPKSSKRNLTRLSNSTASAVTKPTKKSGSGEDSTPAAQLFEQINSSIKSSPSKLVDSSFTEDSEVDEPTEETESLLSDLDNDDNEKELDDEENDADYEDASYKKTDAPDDADEHLIDVTTESDTIKKFKCSFCGKRSKCRADLKKHIRVHTGVRPHKCKICDASFIQITALRGHETIHTGQKPFACDVCNKKFAIKDRLRLHMRVHTGEKPYKCPQCNMTFARRSQIVQHAKVHSTDRCYKCDECSQTFTTYHMLKAHHNSHRGIKEFMCVACGKKFMRLEGMNKHIRTVHRGSRPYTCNICGKSFKGHLQQHMRLHMGVRPFECPTCKATFTQNSQLTVHMRIHTGDRPYKCQICGANFAHSSACKIHMRSHTGEKPFKCVLCQTSFAQLPHLKKHMRCVHNAEKPYLCTTCCNFFQTQQELDMHKQLLHGMKKTNEEEAEQTVEEATLAKLRARLAVLLYRISSEERRSKFGFGRRIIDDVLKTSLKSSGHDPITDPDMSTLNELRQNVLLLLKWTIPVETMEEYHKNSMTVDEVLEMLTS